MQYLLIVGSEYVVLHLATDILPTYLILWMEHPNLYLGSNYGVFEGSRRIGDGTGCPSCIKAEYG